jgi:hypothetical integral membrane protein (TIGR02206 family)
MNPTYSFSYFNYEHIINLIFCLILGFGILKTPKYSKINVNKFGSLLGYAILLLKIFETIYRIKYEHFTLPESLPLHFCNFTMIICGVYLITKNNTLFNIAYFFSFGAVLALILPGVNTYYHQLFFILFMVSHASVVITVLYGFIWLKSKPTFNGMTVSIITVLALFLTSYFYNNKFGTNFMFLKEYVAPFLDFIKPFSLYTVLLVTAFILLIILLYIPFRKNKRG